MPDDDLLETLLAIERAGWDSLCDGTAAQFYGETMTADAVMVLANGAVMDRDTVTQALADAPPWRTYEISDARLIAAGPDVGVVVYIGTAYGDGAEAAFVGAMSSVYHRVGPEWHLALYQQTGQA